VSRRALTSGHKGQLCANLGADRHRHGLDRMALGSRHNPAYFGAKPLVQVRANSSKTFVGYRAADIGRHHHRKIRLRTQHDVGKVLLKRWGTLHAGRNALGHVAALDLSVGSAVKLLLTSAPRSSSGALAQWMTVDRDDMAVAGNFDACRYRAVRGQP
jgi:hypothetical protein